MSVTIDNTVLKYKTNRDKYIITSIDEIHSAELDTYLDDIFNFVFPFYSSRKLQHSNVCGNNAEFICKNLKTTGLIPTLGKIIIVNWIDRNNATLGTIESVYGPRGVTIGSSYHALAYLEVTVKETTYYIAIETTICTPYKLQFYVGSNREDFETIIKSRYQCSDFKISYDCDKSWTEIAYRGGKRRKTKNKKRKQKTRKNTRS